MKICKRLLTGIFVIVKMENTPPNDKKDRIVHASFRKVVAFDLLFLGFGILIGIGIGVYLIAR